MKKLFALLLIVILAAGALAGCGETKESVVVGMITDTGGLGDQSFNDSAWYGLERAETDFGVERKVLESATADDYLPNLTSFSEENVELT